MTGRTVAKAQALGYKVPADCPLSQREFDNLVLLSSGLTLEQIAQKRGVSRSTVRGQLQKARNRFPDIHSSAQLVMLTFTNGWLGVPVDQTFQDEKATAGQHMYLRAFERFLQEGSGANRKEMDHMLRAMWYEAEKLPPIPSDPHGLRPRLHGIE